MPWVHIPAAHCFAARPVPNGSISRILELREVRRGR